MLEGGIPYENYLNLTALSFLMAFTRITIISNTKPGSRNINEELQWFGSSLGLFGLRDKDKSCFRVFIVLIKHTGKGLSSDDIAAMLNLTRGTVVHHLNKLMDSGIVVSERGKYLLRTNSLTELVAHMKKSVSQQLDELEKVAEDIDKRLQS